jgi:preprotein translocase subunit SecF
MMSRLGDVGGRLYRGDVSINFVGRQKLWYTISGCILVIAILALLIRGLNFSVDFKGGSIFQVKAPNATITQVEQAVSDGGGGAAVVQKVGVGSSAQWQAQTAPLTITQTEHVQDALAKEFGLTVNDINTTFVGPTWGSQISSKAIEALIAFLIVIVIYLSIAFEWKMASAAFVALMHDILITVGIYALAGFQVSPATVIGLLTILGYSLYDTVVVFDKVRENTAGLVTTARSTYSQAANLALNQTLVRSINTSIIALLPVTAILIAGTLLLGTGELSDLALVLFVGMLSGTYSSIFIATPVLADLKEREPQYKALAKRVAARAASPRVAARTQATVPAGSGVTAGSAARPADSRAGSYDDLAGPAGDGPAGDGADGGAGDGTGGGAGNRTGGDAGGDTGAAAAAPAAPAGRPRAQPPGARAAGTRSGTSGSRQQPRRSSASGRRSSGAKKKRR